MTGSEDSSSTRPISVAELLAKNGTIGAPPVGGRRRRRRGNADAVTVAELTGEIPIVRPTDTAPSVATPAVDEQPEEVAAEPREEVVSTNGAADHTEVEPEATAEPEVAEEPEAVPEDVVVDEAVDEAEADVAELETEQAEADEEDEEQADDDYADAVAEYAAHLEQRDAEPGPVEFVPPPPRRFGFGRRSSTAPAGDAEQMLPDPVDDDDETALLESPADLDEAPEIEDLDDEAALAADDDGEELPSYLRSTQEPLFGGQTVADDLARRGSSRPAPDDADLGELEAEDERDDEAADLSEPRRMSSFVHGLWIVGQSVIAVAFGAGLFVAFDQLWKWNNIIALVLSVLVILGLVVGVRVVRKTEDIGSTLIAVAVGALVTLGPLALLQSG